MRQFRIDGNEFKQHIHRIDQLYVAPLGHRFLDGKHLGQPDVVSIDFLKYRTQIESRALVGEDHNKLLFAKIVMVLNMLGKISEEGHSN